ncbi:MAG: radical SAM protein, partial [Patescibacteria group bacterium]|nr:radical SAM protein [Patescibacteria group bacterium]
MKALLVSSPKLGTVTRTDIAPPLNLLYVAAVFRRHGVECSLFDMNLVSISSSTEAEDQRLAALRAEVLECQPDIVGISCLTTAHFPFMRRAASLVRHAAPHAKILLGGVHGTLFAADILANCPDFDYIILGEGEEQVGALAERFAANNASDPSQIQSLAWRGRDGKTCISQRTGYITDLDTIPMPAWDLIDFTRYYRNHAHWHNPKGHDIRISIPILATRSCPYDCNFCCAHMTMGRGFRKRSPGNVADEIEYHVRHFGHRYFGFADDNLTLDKRHAIAVCEEIVRRRLDIQFESFNGYNLASLDAEVVAALAAAGCVYAILPVEHGCERMRNDVIGKHLPDRKVFEVMALYREHHIQTRAMFIMGFPEDTPESLDRTRRMIEELAPDMVDVFTLIPFPGTKVFRQATRDGLFVDHVDQSRLWEGLFRLDTKDSGFYLKPYTMSLEE